MAVRNDHKARSDLERTAQAWRSAERHIAVVPDGECEEIRQSFAQKGFSGHLLGDVLGPM